MRKKQKPVELDIANAPIKCVVTDTETTGMSETDEVCEIGLVNVHAWGAGAEQRAARGLWWKSLVKPNCPVSSEGRAAHHISDAELATAPSMERLIELMELMGGGLSHFTPSLETETVLVAHNLEFDVRLLKQSGFPESLMPVRKICTYRCAKHMWPDVRSSNQVLRYHLNLDVPELDGPPHRALPDAMVTSSLLLHMLTIHDVDQLVHLTTAPLLLHTCHMGEHAGKPWSDVDVGFLRWLVSKGPRRPNPRGGRDIGFDEDTMNTAQHWLNVRTGRMF